MSAARWVVALGLLSFVGTGDVAALDREPDLANGLRIVVGGGPGGPDTACFPCHGLQGAGDAVAAFPRLAGQLEFYLYKQMKDYASGLRPDPIMSPIAHSLSAAEMHDVAAYYARAEAPYAPPPRAVHPEVHTLGAELAREGAPERGVPPCMSCHGDEGLGVDPALPYLAGQYASYAIDQLTRWRRGERRNDPAHLMEDVARRLTEEEMLAVALFFESVRPPAPMDDNARPR
jgi:cytochrome c553